MKETKGMMEKRQVSDTGRWAAYSPTESRYHGNVAIALPAPQPVHHLLKHLWSPHNLFAGQQRVDTNQT